MTPLTETSAMEQYAARAILRYEVTRAIFCPRCSAVLDVRSAVVVELNGATLGVSCGACFTPKLRAAILGISSDVTLYEGRTLSAPRAAS
jgi:hypothetical protein